MGAQGDAVRVGHPTGAKDGRRRTVVAQDDPLTAGLGLRERKRLAAMRRIQQVALDLFDEHGFGEVTIEQIAADAEVSPSSVYRYFGTKEQLVLWDEYDPAILRGVVGELQEAPPLEAIRRVISTLVGQVFDQEEPRIRRRVRYTLEEPSVRAASALQSYEMAEMVAGLIGARLERDASDLDVQLFAHALIGGLVGGIHHWYEHGFATPFSAIIDRVFASIEGGFDLA
jgi:AcrR family transcriptional regulator